MTGMMLRVTIDGKEREIELSPYEMNNVYMEVKRRNDRELIRDAIKAMVEGDELTIEQAEALDDDEIMQDILEDYAWETEDDDSKREVAKDILWRYAE